MRVVLRFRVIYICTSFGCGILWLNGGAIGSLLCGRWELWRLARLIRIVCKIGRRRNFGVSYALFLIVPTALALLLSVATLALWTRRCAACPAGHVWVLALGLGPVSDSVLIHIAEIWSFRVVF